MNVYNNLPLRRGRLFGAVLLAATLCASPASAAGSGGKQQVEIGTTELARDTMWEGVYHVRGHITVPAGTTLRIAAGSKILFDGADGGITVLGDLEARGEEGRPVIFAPRDDKAGRWQGIRALEGDTPLTLSHVEVRGARIGLATIRRRSEIAGTLFADNDVAVDASLGSRLTIRDSRFDGNDKAVHAQLQSLIDLSGCTFGESPSGAVLFVTGSGGVIEDCTFRGGMAVAVKRGSDIHISGSTFRDCLLGLNLDEARHDVRIEGNVFEGGGTGILCQNFSTPWIACCEFRNLENGVVATRQSRPMVRHCLFGGNKRGIDVNQKSDPPLEKNLFRDNDTAVFIDMSSYPRLRENDFAREEMAVALGIYMSADWERRVGSGGLSRGEASRRGSRNMGDIEKMGAYGGEVDARENWWGAEATAEMKRLGPDGDITVIDDYFDRPEVSYPGFGEGAYRLDRVIYHPWLVTAVADAGPVAGGCGDIEFEPAKPRQEQKPDR